MKNRTFSVLVLVLLLTATALVTIGMDSVGAADSTSVEPAYLSQVFPTGQVISVEVILSETDWQAILNDPMAEQYYSATVVINGEKIRNVGFRAKGNSSLSSVANGDSQRFSFKIDFDQFVPAQTLDGLTKLNLNNNFSDASSMREYLAYQAFAELGVPTPATAYAQVSINGQLWGLYLAVEGIESPFLRRYYGEASGALYKPEGTGADLKWRGEDPEEYPGIISQNKNVQTDNQTLIEFLRALETGERLEQYLDVDGALRYLAVSTALVNFDSYQGQMLHNYYLYEQDGQMIVLPWDLNMAFGGFGQGGGSVYIDEPTMGAVADRPLVAKLLSVPEYAERYHRYLRQIAEGFLSSERMQAAVTEIDRLIRPCLVNDPTKFYTLEQYESAVSGNNGLLAFANTQATNILQQLAGELPSTNGGQGSGTGMHGGGMPGGTAWAAGGDLAAGINPGQPAGGIMPGVAPGVDQQELRALVEEARSGNLSEASRAKLRAMGLTEELITQMAQGQLPREQRQGGLPADGQPNQPQTGQADPGQTVEPQPQLGQPGVGGANQRQGGQGQQPGPAGEAQGDARLGGQLQFGQRQSATQAALLSRYGLWVAGGLVLLQLLAIVFVFRLRRRRYAV